jgi:hypothetical protein
LNFKIDIEKKTASDDDNSLVETEIW